MRSFSPSLLAGVSLLSFAREVSHAAAVSIGDVAHSEEFQLHLKNSPRSVLEFSHFDDVADKTRYHGRQLRLHLRDTTEDNVHLKSNFAYAVVLLGNDDRGIRALGQSLIDSRTGADLVAILSPKVSHGTEFRVHAQGWRIRRLYEQGVSGDAEIAAEVDDASGSVLAQASAWELTEYERVVLLEESMIVVENIDELFKCSGVCAVMQQAEVVSTALIVLEPALETYESMVQAFGKTDSFSNNFEGFFNPYLDGFENCVLFDLKNPALWDPSTDPSRGPSARSLDHSCHRLPTRYNADLALLALNGGLDMVRAKQPMPGWWWQQKRAKVVRFTLAGLRPWMWFAAPFLPFLSVWGDAYGRAKLHDPASSVLSAVLWWLLFVFAVLAMRTFVIPAAMASLKRKMRSRSGRRAARSVDNVWTRLLVCLQRWRRDSTSTYDPRGPLACLAHLVVGYFSLACGLYVGARQVPAFSEIWVSWATFIVWTSTVVGLLWSVYLWIISVQAMRFPRSNLPRASHVDNFRESTLSPLHVNYNGIDAYRRKAHDKPRGDVALPSSPWGEGVVSLVLFGLVLAFLPAWQRLSGASSASMMLVPVFLALWCLVVGLTVQMLRLPPLWCDRVRLLALLEAEGLHP